MFIIGNYLQIEFITGYVASMVGSRKIVKGSKFLIDVFQNPKLNKQVWFINWNFNIIRLSLFLLLLLLLIDLFISVLVIFPFPTCSFIEYPFCYALCVDNVVLIYFCLGQRGDIYSNICCILIKNVECVDYIVQSVAEDAFVCWLHFIVSSLYFRVIWLHFFAIFIWHSFDLCGPWHSR